MKKIRENVTREKLQGVAATPLGYIRVKLLSYIFL